MSSIEHQYRGAISNQILQIGINNFFRLSFAIYSIFLGCIFFPFAILSTWYFGQSFIHSRDQISDAIENELSVPTTIIAIFISIVFAILGSIQSSSSRSSDNKVALGYLLPIQTWKYVLISDLVDAFLLTAAILLGIIPAVLVGFDFYLGDSIPIFLVFSAIGSGIIRCREDVRYWAFFAILLCGLYSLVMQSDSTHAAISQEVQTWSLQIVCGFIVFSNFCVTLLILDSHRKGKVYGGAWIVNSFHNFVSRKFDARRASSGPHLIEFQSLIGALVWFDFTRTFKRIIPWIFGINAIGFCFSFTNASTNFVAEMCIVATIIYMIVSAFRICLRSNNVLNQLPSHQATLPISDRTLGYIWLGNFTGSLILGLIAVGISLIPYFVKNSAIFEWSLNLAMILPVLLSALFVLQIIFTVLMSGRPYLIVSLFFLVVFAVFFTGYSVTSRNTSLLNGQIAFLNLLIGLIYVLITIQSYKRGIVSWLTQSITGILVAWQIVTGHDFFLNTSLGQTGLYGTILLPGFSLVATPLAVHYNRHR